MAEPFTIGVIVAAAVLLNPAARERERLKKIAHAANKYHQSPDAARTAFLRMANANNSQVESVERVDSLPPANVRPASPTRPLDNFAQNPIPVIPDIHQKAREDVSQQGAAHNHASGQQSLLPRYLPDHCREAINKKWAAKKARKDARYQKQCDKLDHKYGGTETRRTKKQQTIDSKHRETTKGLELKRCMEISMGEWRARRKAEKKQQKGLSTEHTQPAAVQASTDGAGEYPSQRSNAGSRLSSNRRLTRDSSSDGIFSLTTTGWQPTTLNVAGQQTLPTIIGGGKPST